MSMLRMARRGLLVLCAVAAGLAGAQPAPEPLPAEAFYRQPDFDNAVLSPSGRWLALSLSPGGGRKALAVLDLAGGGPLKLVANFNDADVGSFHWVNDERLVFSVYDGEVGSGERAGSPGLFTARRDGSEQMQLVRQHRDSPVSAGSAAPRALSANHRLLHIPQRGDDIIVGESQHDVHGEFVGLLPKRLNTATRRVTSLAAGLPTHVFQLLFDPQGEPRLATTLHAGRSAVHWKPPGADSWQLLAEFESLKAPFVARYIDAAGNLYVTVARGKGGTTQLHKFDFATKRPVRDALVVTPGFDFQGGLVSEQVGGAALGVRVLTDGETTAWFDPAMAALQRNIDERLPGRINRLDCRRCDQPDRVVLVRAWSDRDPGQYWLYRDNADPAQVQWQRVGVVRRAIDPQRMGSTALQRIRARDGLELPVWITTPAAAASGPRPAVVLVHGGPWVRGRDWRWSADAQFLASRGYVVIEPEFRGSRGYGVAHHQAGWRQWGRAMQDDVADALGWAVQQGAVDPKRVCIAGASYGGYATLMGLVNDPQLYRCGIAWVAVTDPRLMFKWSAASDVGTEAREFDLPRLIGDPVADAEMLSAVSPLVQARRIQAPVLLAFGQADRRVPMVHGTRMRDALREAGQQPEWVVYEDEGHGWWKLANRVDFAQRVERFLADKLK